MKNLIKYFLILFFIPNISFSTNSSSEKIIFKVNNKAFVTSDLEDRNKYYKLLLNDEYYNHDNIMDDLISISIFDVYFSKYLRKKNYNTEVEYNNRFKIYENNKNNNLRLIFNELGKDSIIKFLEMDLKRKLILEKILETKKNLLIQDVQKKDLLYNLIVKYYIINQKDFNNINNSYDLNNIIDEKKFSKILKQNKIKYLYKEDIADNQKSLDIRIKNSIKIGDNVFKILIDNYVLYGSVQKKLKSYEGVNVQLVNIQAKKEIPLNLIKCNKIDSIDKEYILDITSGEYKYTALNDLIKDKLYTVDNYIKISNNNLLNYIILCKLSFDKNLFNEIALNQKVNNLASKIEREFVNKYSKEFNLIIINE